MSETVATAAFRLVNEVGLHARPSVKLAKLAKTFAAKIEVASTAEGPWVDAKSVVKVMAFKARQGEILYFRAAGPDAESALAALAQLVEGGFHEGGEAPHG